MTSEELKKIYESRPFNTRNADEYDLENILDLFVDPTDGLSVPFDYSNSIIKGKMGSGKTMYLRANYAYYLYTLVPCLIDGSQIILPVYIKLSDFQNEHDPEKIYYAIIIKIIEEIVSVCRHLQSSEELSRLHLGASTLTDLWVVEKNAKNVLKKLEKLTAEEYVKTISKSFSAKGSATAKFIDLYTDYEMNTVSEIKRHDKPTFQNVVDTCESLLSPFNGKLLLLFDEIGSLNKKFFKSTGGGDSYFETLMNQLRTLSYVRTKLAVYPNSYSDILKETRYGDIIELECDVSQADIKYRTFLTKTVSLIERYIEKASGIKCNAEDVFELTVEDQLIIEQIINASEANMRRLVHLLDLSMNSAYIRSQGKERVSVEDVWLSLKKQGEEMESQHKDADREFIDRIAKVCRTRSTYKFTLPNQSMLISKFTSLSEEYNIVNIRQLGTGRKGTIYSFDYAYCVYKDLPTHYIKNTEKIDKKRSSISGDPIKRVAQLSPELLLQSELLGRVEGIITFLDKKNSSGFAKGSDGKAYFITKDYVISSDRKKKFLVGNRIIFTPSELPDGSIYGVDIEII